jgi:hypothetical protein
MSLTAFKKWKGGRGSAQLQTPLNTIFGFQEKRSQSTDSIEIGPGHRPRSQTDPLENNLAPPLFVVRITKEIDEVADQDLQPLYKELGLDAFHKDANDLVFGKEGEVVAGTSKRLIEHMVDERPQGSRLHILLHLRLSQPLPLFSIPNRLFALVFLLLSLLLLSFSLLLLLLLPRQTLHQNVPLHPSIHCPL